MKKTTTMGSMKRPKPRMWSEEKIPVKTVSQQNEVRLAEEIGFKLTPGSGNQAWAKGKGDGRLEAFMFECKETTGSRITVSNDILGKLCREAMNAGRDPALVLSAHGMPYPIPKDWVAVPSALFAEMLKAYLAKEENDGNI